MQDVPIEQSSAGGPHTPPGEVGAEGSTELADIAQCLRLLEQQGAEYHLRATHREAVIDRLHLENQRLRDEVRGSALDPITADLMRLHEGLRADADRLAESRADSGIAKLIRSYAEDVELILDRCGLEPFIAEPGESLRLGEHSVAATVETAERARANTIAEIMAVGFREKVTGQVKRPVRAKFYRLAQPSDPGKAD
jgi:molecular chaperone GrpE